jgi:hypothetical protein
MVALRVSYVLLCMSALIVSVLPLVCVKLGSCPCVPLNGRATDGRRTTDGPRGRRAGVAGVVVGLYKAEPRRSEQKRLRTNNHSPSFVPLVFWFNSLVASVFALGSGCTCILFCVVFCGFCSFCFCFLFSCLWAIPWYPGGGREEPSAESLPFVFERLPVGIVRCCRCACHRYSVQPFQFLRE